jgi:hypothetical protein
LTVEQRAFLRASARRTWRFFAEFVGPHDNWLPPDNFQEYPTPAIASRTSPTNIGMSLLASLAAHDFGYISAGEFLRRTEHTLATMEKLERYRGHFYNWYETDTLKPLRPQYVSSVRLMALTLDRSEPKALASGLVLQAFSFIGPTLARSAHNEVSAIRLAPCRSLILTQKFPARGLNQGTRKKTPFLH